MHELTGSTVQDRPLPQRIVSLVPSQTELLHHLGLDDKVVGITKFCVHPESWFRSKTRVGGTKTVDIEKIKALQPDLVLGNKEENDREQIETLSAEFPVYISEVNDFSQALDMIRAVGALTGTSSKAESLVADIVNRFDALEKKLHRDRNIRVAYLIWQSPYMAAGGGTFINSLLEKCGMENVFGHLPRYPVLQPADIKDAAPELVLLSSEPFPFDSKMLDGFKNEFPEARCMLVDGESFSWYGPRMIYAADYIEKLSAAIDSPPVISVSPSDF
jgi:ABC-type Fe3+-hydroxamate transport system substrate-binding protein